MEPECSREDKTHSEGLIEQCREHDNPADPSREGFIKGKDRKRNEDFAMRKDVVVCHEQYFSGLEP